MVAARLHTTQLPVEHRFAAWTELATRAHVPTLVDSRHRSDFVASIESHTLGSVQLSNLLHPPLRAKRTPAMARSGDPDVLLVTHILGGGLTRYGEGGGETSAGPGTILAIDPNQPATIINASEIRYQVLQLPMSLLGLRRPQVEGLLAGPLATSHGIGGVLAYVLTDLGRNADSYEPAVVAQLTATAVDLLATAARVAHGDREPAMMSMAEHTRRVQIYAFMACHLADPGLTPDAVAAAHGISVRQLNRILQADGVSPADWIRRQRLQRCRRDLVDPSLSGRSAAAIGAAWGFADPVTFNRAFRREYAMPPGEYRRRHAIR